MKSKKVSAILAGGAIIGSFSWSPVSLAQGVMYSEEEQHGFANSGYRKEAIDFLNEVQKEVRTSIKTVPGTAIRGIVKPNQYPTQLRFVGYSGSAQFDADCVEALLDKQRQDSNPMILSGLWPLPAELTSECPNKRADGKVLIFKIPPSALTKYPNIFKPTEIFTERNYVELHSKGTAQKLTDAQISEINNHYQQWHAFLDAHPKATKDEIVEATNEG